MFSSIIFPKADESLSALEGLDKARAHCKYFVECKPEDKIKFPSRRAPAYLNSFKTYSFIIQLTYKSFNIFNNRQSF